MRPKLIALIAVSAVALVGCSAGEPSVEPTTTVTVTATPELSPEAIEQTPAPNETAESMFADFAEDRADAQGVKKPSREKVIDALNAFCDDGKPFNVSTSKALNENLTMDAERSACESID